MLISIGKLVHLLNYRYIMFKLNDDLSHVSLKQRVIPEIINTFLVVWKQLKIVLYYYFDID